MVKLPSLKPKQIEKILLKNGFLIKRQTESHRIYYNKTLDKIVIVPFHSKDIPLGTLRSIIRQSDLAIDLFVKGK